jgi:taurine dioxygenase
MPLQINKLSHSLGAEISGLDLSQPLDDVTISTIRQAWVDHLVLCFPGQNLSPPQQISFCARFGPLDDHRNRPLWNRPDYPEVNIVSNKPQTIGGKKLMTLVADKWHTDMSFSDRSATASWLHALQLPEIGGDTMFANMYRAYEALSPKMQALAEQLQGVHDVSGAPDFHRYTPEVQAERKRNYPPVVHPVVRVHAESGRKGLFVGGFLKHFVGLTERESRPLIDFYNEFSTAPEFTYRHRWKTQDVLMWDNRCTMHFAVQDYDPMQLRVLQRCTLFAPVSGQYYDPDEPDGIRKTSWSRKTAQACATEASAPSIAAVT